MANGGKCTVILGAAVLALVSFETAFAETYYGSQLMSPTERAEHGATMRSLSPNEREAYRAEHHEAMKKRAESQGLTLPDQPPTYGQGYGRGGPGYGYGRGVPGYGYGRGGPGYGYGCGGPGYGYGCGGPGYRGPNYGNWGPPAW
jgi:hypothetical protein